MGAGEFISVFLLGAGLSMDAFAVSVCKGLAVRDVKIKHLVLAGAWFGSFQALMPLVGFFLGTSFHSYIARFDYLVAFVLLLFIGANMLKEAFSSGEEGKPADASFGVKTMLLMAIATSIDALAAGIALAMDETGNIWISVLMIGITTFILSAVGVKIGSIFGEKYQKKARIAGGAVLILIGLKVLLEHFGVL